MRLDLYLVEKGLAPTRNRAQELIAAGFVFVIEGGSRKTLSKPSLKIDPTNPPEILIEEENSITAFVSRGGLKLKGALQRTGFQVDGLSVLDLGISTGGFADCLLKAGVRQVVGVDVGHGQLAAELQHDSRIRHFEGVNARDLSRAPLLEANGGDKFDLIVADLSFISLALVLPQAIQYLKKAAPILALVKPQFEVGREGIGKSGIVKDPALHAQVEEKIRRTCKDLGLAVEDYFESSIEGSDGNREFFVFARAN